MSKDNKNNIKDSLKKLEEISQWFEEQEEVDVEVGLQKVKESAVIIKSLREQLKEAENEFELIKKDLQD